MYFSFLQELKTNTKNTSVSGLRVWSWKVPGSKPRNRCLGRLFV